jgi:Metallo-beta-lactamase superfamily
MSLVIEPMPDLGITRVSRWTFNCYVIGDADDGPVVVDAGLPGTHDDLAPVLRELGGSLKAIVATHGHGDHVAGAPRLAERHGAAIHLPARTLAYFDNERPRTPTPAQVAKIWPVLLDQPIDRRGVVGLIRGACVAGFGTSPVCDGPGQHPPADSPTASRCPAPRAGRCSRQRDIPMTASRYGMKRPGH